MSQHKNNDTGRTGALTLAEFMAKHNNDFLLFAGPIRLSRMFVDPPVEERPTMPISLLKRELKRWSPIRMLEAAAREDCPEGCELALGLFLQKMGIEPPQPVSISWPRPAGRPRSQKGSWIFMTWVRIGQPSVYSRKLAHAVYGETFTVADTRARKKMVDQCRRAVERELERRQEPHATKFQS